MFISGPGKQGSTHQFEVVGSNKSCNIKETPEEEFKRSGLNVHVHV